MNWRKFTLETHPLFEELCTAGEPAELLADEQFRQQTESVTVDAESLALYFEDGLFKQVLTPGVHIFWKNSRVKTFKTVNISIPEIDADIDRQTVCSDAAKAYVTGYSIEPYEKGLLYFDKRFIKLLEPGNYFFWKGVQSVNVIKADMRARQLEISGQEIMTKDKVLLRLNFICRYRITEPVTALIENADYEEQLYTALQLALREYVGTLLFDELLQKKEEIGAFVADALKPRQAQFGVEILSSGLKDIILPGEIRDIMNQVLIAEKKAQANVITRREETASTRSLLNTAKLMEENALLLKLKELEYIDKMSEKINQISITGGGQILDQLKELLTGNFSKR
ncbi:MAG: slipin family protein [Treponema sp.]